MTAMQVDSKADELFDPTSWIARTSKVVAIWARAVSVFVRETFVVPNCSMLKEPMRKVDPSGVGSVGGEHPARIITNVSTAVSFM